MLCTAEQGDELQASIKIKSYTARVWLTCSPLSVQHASILSRNGLQDDAVDDAQENDGCIQSSQHVGDAHLSGDVTSLLPEDESAANQQVKLVVGECPALEASHECFAGQK